MSAHVRPMSLEEVGSVAAIAARIMPSSWSEVVFRSCFTPDYAHWILEIEHCIAGYFIAKCTGDEGEIVNWGVDLPFQHQGWGKYFLKTCMNILQSQGILSFWLEVRASNHAAIALYRHYGFLTLGLRKGYYPSPLKEDALVFRYDFKKTQQRFPLSDNNGGFPGGES